MSYSSLCSAITTGPTPVFNTPTFPRSFGCETGNCMELDNQGLFRRVETILFPATDVQVLERVGNANIWRIETSDYPGLNHYVDGRFLRFHESAKNTRKTASTVEMLKTMTKLENSKTPYIWGGNWPDGIPELSQYYPSKRSFELLPEAMQNIWQLKGVDCSGLLYYASNGTTPRNTSGLLTHGKALNIEGCKIDKILEQLKPLDLIAWMGHVICVLDKTTFIESKNPDGVVFSDAYDRLEEVMNTRIPVNHWRNAQDCSFVVRRWHPEQIV